MIILGYAGFNGTLRKQHVMVNRTCRESTAKIKGIEYLKSLAMKNLEDLFKTIQWNVENNIKFYRMSSDMFPHCTNVFDNDYTLLAYSLDSFNDILRQIGSYANKFGIRLTFHPNLYNVLNSPNDNVVIKTFRDLHLHATVMNLMGLNNNSIIILHGGGVYGNKIESMIRWIDNFNKLPDYIKERIVLENDETNYSINDVINISKSIKSFKNINTIPIVLDIFHYQCYNLYIKKRQSLELQIPIIDVLPLIKNTWDSSNRIMKLHISEQMPDSVIGTHSDYIKSIPQYLINFANQIKPDNIYLMCECKSKELCLLQLRKKYKICI